jgi:hypothetical protein
MKKRIYVTIQIFENLPESNGKQPVIPAEAGIQMLLMRKQNPGFPFSRE